MVEQDGNAIGGFIVDNNLDWPADENGLIGAGGLFNVLTEEQAEDLAKRIKDLLPRMA